MLATNSWFHDLLVKLWQNLPLALATTIVVSLLVKFWGKLIDFAKRKLGFAEPPKEQISHSFPEGEIAHCYVFKNFRHGFSVSIGWRGAVVDKGVVQRELASGRYRRRAVQKMITSMALSETARVILWRDSEFPVVVSLDDLFAADHQPMQLEMRCVFAFKSVDLMHAYLEEITLPLDHIAKHVSEMVALSMRRWIGSLQGDDPYRHRDRLPEWSETAKELVHSALAESPFEIVRVTDLRLSSPALDRLYSQFGDIAQDDASARTEIERNRVRGALRQAMLSGKLEEMRDQSQFEDAVRVIEQEKALRDKALVQELDQAELAGLQVKVDVWKKKQELLMQVLGPATAGATISMDSGRRAVEDFRRAAVDSADSPFSAQERQQIAAILQAAKTKSAKPEEILSAVLKESDIPKAIFDPLAMIRGSHTLSVGSGWRLFDGESLWQVRLTQIVTRRHGFLWRRESPAQARFELRASPSNRHFDQTVDLEAKFVLEMGSHGIPVEYLGGTPSRISVRVPA